MTTRNAKCPYYSCETKKFNILCYSDVPPPIKLAYKFPSMDDKLRHRQKYCTTYDYINCPVYYAIEKHYK